MGPQTRLTSLRKRKSTSSREPNCCQLPNDRQRGTSTSMLRPSARPLNLYATNVREAPQPLRYERPRGTSTSTQVSSRAPSTETLVSSEKCDKPPTSQNRHCPGGNPDGENHPAPEFQGTLPSYPTRIKLSLVVPHPSQAPLLVQDIVGYELRRHDLHDGVLLWDPLLVVPAVNSFTDNADLFVLRLHLFWCPVSA
jgi:hypothetical protein